MRSSAPGFGVCVLACLLIACSARNQPVDRDAEAAVAQVARTGAVPDTLTDADRAAIADTLRELYRNGSQTFDAAADCAEIADWLADRARVLFVAQGRLYDTGDDAGGIMDMCKAIKHDRLSAEEEIHEQRVELLNRDAAVVVTRGVYAVRYRDGRSMVRPQVVTTAWTRGGSGWRMVHLHESWPGVEVQDSVADFLRDPIYPADLDAAKLARIVDDHLAAARAAVERLLAASGGRTAANTLRPLDEARNHEMLAQGMVDIAVHVHPDSAVRAEGLRAQTRVSGFRNELRADARVMYAFAAVDTAALSDVDRLLHSRVLRDFRRAGAHLDEVTRGRLRAKSESMDRLGTAFARNLAEDTTTVLATVEELAGLPPDWIDRHRRSADGRVILTMSYPDVFPVIRYAANRSLRQRVVIGFANRAWPANAVVLDSLLQLREGTARLLGYPNWASYQAEVRMAGSLDSIRIFVDRVRRAAEPARATLLERYHKRLQHEDPSVRELWLGDLGHAAELTTRDEFAVDDREVRAYLPFAHVKEGLLDVMSEAFGLDFRRVSVPVWHPLVEAYEARENGRLIGRFYLDLHPRPGKYTHAAVMPLRPGIRGRQLAEAMLVANFPGGEAGDPGLLERADVAAFFHEFGHLLHAMFARTPYATTAWPDEHDFIEAPSQLLEALAWSPAVLRRITRHVETGEPIPGDLALRTHQASALDRPVEVARMIATSAISLELHDRPHDQVDVDSVTAAAIETHMGIRYPPEAHLASAIEHFAWNDYSAAFYTYLWSQVIAEDLRSALERDGSIDGEALRRYRDTVLRAGGSRPAAQLIEDFLGRPFDFGSWQQWVEGRR